MKIIHEDEEKIFVSHNENEILLTHVNHESDFCMSLSYDDAVSLISALNRSVYALGFSGCAFNKECKKDYKDGKCLC